MKLLVTGGAGFIGSAVVRAAIAQGHSVVNVDKLTYAACLDNVASVADNESYVFFQGDICDRAAMDRILKETQPEAIMHLAAESHVDRSIDGPGAFIETNVTGTYTLLESYLTEGSLQVNRMGRGYAWLDTGTHGSLLDAGNFVRTLQSRQGLQTGCLEEIAFENDWISAEQLRALAEPLQKNGYGAYLMGLLD